MSTPKLVAAPKEASAQPTWTQEQIELVKRTICKGATDDQLKLFMHICQRTGLDPFARQIYATFRRDQRTNEIVMTVQTGIDGFRLTATRTGLYAGRDEAQFEYKNDKPIKCKVTVYKIVAGVRCAWTATAKWDEYYPGEKLGFMWQKLPETMLEKCCEAKALRMAFPAELSGIYGKEEMDQAEAQKPVIGTQRVIPEQPGEDDGEQDPTKYGYRIPFGQWKARTIEEVAEKFGIEKVKSYITYLEDAAVKKGVELGDMAKEFIDHASSYIAAVENGEGFEADVP